MISYPRTSSQKLPARLGLKQIIEKIAEKGKYKEYARHLLSEGKLKPREGKKDDVHPAIYPTGIIEKMTGDEEKLYDLIARRFLACFSDSAEIEHRKITINANEKYVSEYIHIVKDGWLSIYNPGIKEDKIPDLVDGEKVSLEKIKITKKKTKAPSRYSPAEIIKKLEQLNIGTKTTRPIILDNLYKRKYIEGERIRVLPLGRIIHEIFSKYAPEVVDVDLTRKLEKEMDEIKDGRKKKGEVIDKTKEIIKKIIQEMQAKKEEIKKELTESFGKTGIKCICGGELILHSKGGKRFLGCSNYPKCRITYSLPVDNFKFIGYCKECGAPKILVFGKKKYSLCLNKECKSKKVS
jgi:DNA topoisomerase-1